MTDPTLAALAAVSHAHHDADDLTGHLHTTRRQLIVTAHREGVPVTLIAATAGVSRQRVWQLLDQEGGTT